jgi:hypothetical protein
MNKKIVTLNSKKLIADTLQNKADNTIATEIDSEGTGQTVQVDLRKLMTYHEDGRCSNAFSLITSKPMLLAAY